MAANAAETEEVKEPDPIEYTQDTLKFDYAYLWVNNVKYKVTDGWYMSNDYAYNLAMGAQTISLRARQAESERDSFKKAYKSEYENATNYRNLLEDMYKQYDDSVKYRKQLEDVYEQQYSLMNKQINKYKKQRDLMKNILIGVAVIGGVIAICN